MGDEEGCDADSVIWLCLEERGSSFPKKGRRKETWRERCAWGSAQAQDVLWTSQVSLVAETLSVRRMERAAKLGRWEQIRKYSDSVRSQIFILWIARIMDVTLGGSGCWSGPASTHFTYSVPLGPRLKVSGTGWIGLQEILKSKAIHSGARGSSSSESSHCWCNVASFLFFKRGCKSTSLCASAKFTNV